MGVTVLAQTSTNDLQLTNGKLVLVEDNAEQVAILLKNRLQFFKGEWFLDAREGVPFYDLVLVKAPDRAFLARMFRNIVLDTPGVSQVLELTAELTAATRHLDVNMRVQTTTGAIIAGGTGQPFIVEPA